MPFLETILYRVFEYFVIVAVIDLFSYYILGLEDDLGNKIKDEKYECLEYDEIKSL